MIERQQEWRRTLAEYLVFPSATIPGLSPSHFMTAQSFSLTKIRQATDAEQGKGHGVEPGRG